MTQAIATTGLTKDFGSGRGVLDLDLSVDAGEIFGFIGPNGAGKTTTIRLLLDLIRPDRGTAHVLGYDARRDSLRVRSLVGYVPGELPQYGSLRATEILGLLARLRGLRDMTRVTSLAHRLDLDADRRFTELSHGNKQKVLIVQAFMHRPRVLLLDEPTLGLDPVMQQEFRALLREAVADGATVFLSSHVLSEVEQACDRIAIIQAGRLSRVGTMRDLNAMRIHRVSVTVERPVERAALDGIEGVSDVVVADGEVRCAVRGTFAPLVEALRPAGIVEIDSQELSLQELFLADRAS